MVAVWRGCTWNAISIGCSNSINGVSQPGPTLRGYPTTTSTRAYWYSRRRWSRATSTAAGATRSASERRPTAKRRSSGPRGSAPGVRRLSFKRGIGLPVVPRGAHRERGVVVQPLAETLATCALGRPAGQEELGQLQIAQPPGGQPATHQLAGDLVTAEGE